MQEFFAYVRLCFKTTCRHFQLGLDVPLYAASFGLPFLAWEFPSYWNSPGGQTTMNGLWWQIPAGCTWSILAVRLLLSPYWVYRERVAVDRTMIEALRNQLEQETTKQQSLGSEIERLRIERPLRQIEKRNALDQFIADGKAILERLKEGTDEQASEFERWVSAITAFGNHLKLVETQILEGATDDADGTTRVLEMVSGCGGLPTERAICAVADMLVRLESLRERLQD